MFTAVFFAHGIGIFTVTFFDTKTGEKNSIKTKPGRKVVEHIVETGREFAKIKILFVFFAPHGVKGVHCPVQKHKENSSFIGKKPIAKAKPEKACKRAVQRIFRKAFNACTDDVVFIHGIGISAHNSGELRLCFGNVFLQKFFLDSFNMEG